MQVISHRGYWKTPAERNQRVAFERSFDNNMGTETDLRDICGKIVISHDMPKGSEITFEEVLQIMDGRNLPLALNIKADGQIDEILRLLTKYGHTNYFTFDMSIPDMIVQADKGASFYTGLSDILTAPVLFDEAAGVWLDSFNGQWWTAETADDLIAHGKSVCIVSEDLHKRDSVKQWREIKRCRNYFSDNLILCTDKPQEACSFFSEDLP